MRIILVSFYRASRLSQYPNAHSLSSMRLAAYVSAKHHSWDVGLLAYPDDMDADAIVELVSQYNPDIVGLPAYMWNRTLSQKVTEGLNCYVVVGGPEVNMMSLEEWSENTYFVLGQGEEGFNWICERLARNQTIEHSPFAVFQRSDKARDLASNRITRTDTLPIGLPLYSDEFNQMFWNHKPDGKFTWFETVRGCTFTCSFCGHNTLPFFASFDNGHVQTELMHLHQQEFREIFIIDPILGGLPDRGKWLLKALRKYAPHVGIRAYLRPEFLDGEFVDLLGGGKVVELLCGIQTTNPNVPRHVRGNNFSRIERYLPMLSKRNIPWRTELIVGLPGDTMEGLKESLRFTIDRLRPTTVYTYQLTAIPETKIYELLDRANDLWLKADVKLRVVESSSFSEMEMQNMLIYSGAMTSLYHYRYGQGESSTFTDLDTIVNEFLQEASAEEIIAFQQQNLDANLITWANVTA